MKRWVLAAGLLAAAVAPQAFAADLDDGEPPPPPSWKAPSWKAPSWKDEGYGYPPKGVPPPSYYEDEDYGPPRGKKYSEDDDGPPPYQKYSDTPPLKSGCVRSEQVRDRLTSLGWGDFHAGKALNPTTVSLRARRPSGRLFELRLDRCSGEILQARALDLSPLRPPYYGYTRPYWGPYGYGAPYMGPYAWGRPYGSSKWPRHWED